MARPGKLRAVLFDMDGTLVDSEPLWNEADKTWLATHGISLSADEWIHIVGLGGGNFVRLLMERKGLKGDYQQLLEEKNEVFRKMAATDSRPFPEMFRFAHEIRRLGIKTAIASASSVSIIDTTLACIGETATFDAEFSGYMVQRSKPDPMLFLHAAEQLGVGPDECLVIEDSQYGVEAGKRAGMTVVAVPYHVHEETRESFERADLLFSRGMEEFRSDILMDWLTGHGLL
jgi:beta-phosphoglucomutase-like phosphatase (HAD superfamily)